MADQVSHLMTKKRIHIVGANVLIMGLTFKENCPDLRNTRVVDVVSGLTEYGVEVDVHDPWVDAGAAHEEYGIDLTASPRNGSYDGVVIAVAHREFAEMGAEKIRAFGKDASIVYDLKNVLSPQEADLRL